MTAKYGPGPWKAEQMIEGKGTFEAKGASGSKTPTELGELLDLGLMVPSMLSKLGGAYNEAIAAANASSKERTGSPTTVRRRNANTRGR